MISAFQLVSAIHGRSRSWLQTVRKRARSETSAASRRNVVAGHTAAVFRVSSPWPASTPNGRVRFEEVEHVARNPRRDDHGPVGDASARRPRRRRAAWRSRARSLCGISSWITSPFSSSRSRMMSISRSMLRPVSAETLAAFFRRSSKRVGAVGLVVDLDHAIHVARRGRAGRRRRRRAGPRTADGWSRSRAARDRRRPLLPSSSGTTRRDDAAACG